MVKALIVASQLTSDPARKRLVENIRGIVFCGTPHRGSAFASAAGVLANFFGGSQDHVKEMEANAEPLDLLHDHFLAWQRERNIPVETYAESLGLFRKTWWGRSVPLGLVVSRASANPGIGVIHDVDADHLNLVKPSPAVPAIHNLIYRGVLRFVNDSLAPALPSVVYAPVDADVPVTGAASSEAAKIDVSRIDKYVPVELVGREAELAMLDDAWSKVVNGEPGRPHILSFIAMGGEGKTSLVAKWLAALAHRDWPGCEAAFAWSFYSQGSSDQASASFDAFLREALIFFGDPAMAESAAGCFDKARRLAHLVGEQRALLILDGLEPLQYPPSSPMPGELKDQGLAALLKGLAASSHGLCLVTSRYSMPDLRGYWQTTAPEQELRRLSKEAGVALLRQLGVTTGAREEFEQLVEAVDGHALTLQIMGGFLKKAFHGDIRCRDRVKFEKAEAKVQGGHAFRAMAAYEHWLADGSDESRQELAILRIMGLFDRPAPADCLHALLAEPVIPGLTEPLVGLDEEDWNCSLDALAEARLLTVNRDPAGSLLGLDAHPLLREYFASRLRVPPGEAWRGGHHRIYDHLCATTPDKDQPTLEDLQPLYQAVAHGCQAGLQEEACAKVYRDRIQRGPEFYSTNKLGALGSDLGAVACFFETTWHRVSPALAEDAQAWLFNEAAFSLRALGRLTEALEPMRVSGEMYVKQEEWEGAAISYSNLSELELTLGMVGAGVADGEQAVVYADRSGDGFWRRASRATHGDALHQAGRQGEAAALFGEAEQMQAERQSDYPLLYSLQGFGYCDLLLHRAEQGAWQRLLAAGGQGAELVAACGAVSERAGQTLEIAERNHWLLDIGLDHLTLGRAVLYRAILDQADGRQSLAGCDHLDRAVAFLRRAGTQDHLPRGFLSRAWLLALTGPRTGPESSQSDLDEAWEIAERGPMPLFMADIHLYRARLFFREADYPWDSPQHDLAEARRLIDKHGYWRRKEELEDAEEAILGGKR